VRAIKVLRFARAVDVARFADLRMDAALAREVEHVTHDVVRHILEREPRTVRFVEDVRNLGPKASFAT
jgi:hypothetical protein